MSLADEAPRAANIDRGFRVALEDYTPTRGVVLGKPFSIVPHAKDMNIGMECNSKGQRYMRWHVMELQIKGLPGGRNLAGRVVVTQPLDMKGSTQTTINAEESSNPLNFYLEVDELPHDIKNLSCRVHYLGKDGVKKQLELSGLRVVDEEGKKMQHFGGVKGEEVSLDAPRLSIPQEDGQTIIEAMSSLDLEAEFYLNEPAKRRTSKTT